MLIYAGPDTHVTLTTEDGLVTGNNYRFVMSVENAFGESEFSEETRVALGGLPGTPEKPTKVEEESTTE
jgi:hypothetical protein